MPRLRVSAGPSFEQLQPVEVNTDKATPVSSEEFEGQVAVYIKGFIDENGRVEHSNYFEKRKGVTWSIQVQGRFLQRRSADDILFGNTFERPLRHPWLIGTALKFMHYIDPSLEHDLTSRTKPWALAPLVATMPHLMHHPTHETHHIPQFPSSQPITDHTPSLISHHHHKGKEGKAKANFSKRRSHFQNPAKRKEVMLGPEDVITADFCYDFLNFSADGIVLRLPGGISFDLMRYWDGQPVRFQCCERIPKGETVDGLPWGRVFWCVVIELAEDAPVLEKI
ncbi:DUF1769-domain-containing protein [Abortiporus biennis]|nr:DUF1769-domain-containing protein [Abortiporus biennis]